MSVGTRRLHVLGEFKSLGLVTESLDGKSVDHDHVPDKYDYFLFNPEVARDRDVSGGSDVAVSTPGDGCDHELFIRGNRLIWSTGLRVYKRFTLDSPIVMACWCRLGSMSGAVLCVLQADCLTIFNTSGELTTIMLPNKFTSMWALPFGLLLQRAAEGSCADTKKSSSSSPLLNARDMSHTKREPKQNHVQKSSLDNHDPAVKRNLALVSSHFILNDPLEEPQPTYMEERGNLKVMKEFDDKTIWTSDQLPLMASYSKEKMQHSLWLVELVGQTHMAEAGFVTSVEVPIDILPRQYSFRPIWQTKGSPMAASKVFLTADGDAAPLVCFLLQEQKRLLCVRLQTVTMNNEPLFDVKADISWSIPAIAAEPVSVTHPRSRAGSLASADIIVLSSENTLFLYSGKQCLCKYSLSPFLEEGKGSENVTYLASSSVNNVKIVGLADAVGSRVNVILSNGQILRCTLRRGPSCSLVDDCITLLAEGLGSSLYIHFLRLLWGSNDTSLSEADPGIESEWQSFSSVIMEMCRKPRQTSQGMSDPVSSSWEFLIRSEFHRNYRSFNCTNHIPSEALVDMMTLSPSSRNLATPQISADSFDAQFLMECMDSLHALYENLKLIEVRKRDLRLLVVLLHHVATFLGEKSYVEYYIRDFPFLSKTTRDYGSVPSPKSPPRLYRWLEDCLLHGACHVCMDDIPALIRTDRSSVVSWARKVVAFYSLLSGGRQMDGKLSTGVSCNIALGSYSSPEEQTVLAMAGEGFGLQQMDLLPVGISLPIRHALDYCRESPPTDWPAAAYVLLGREDLALCCLAPLRKTAELETQTNLHLISMSTPYMRHLNPVTIPSTIFESNGSSNSKLEDTDSADGPVIDGMEHIFNSNSQLRYGKDLRLNEVRRLLCSARPVTIQMPGMSSVSDQDLQQAQLWQLAQRTTALPFGRGALTLATTCTLLTEALTVPKLVLAGRLPAQQNATVNLDPNTRNIQELRAWPEFHNAVAAGLRLAPLQGKVSRTWIMYNRPEEPNSIHAGFLLALGLHGHLRVLAITDIFKYYLQDHESTTVGLMLGLAVSYRGTMEPTIAKSFYVHLPARYPPSFPELEVPTLLQTAALMSLGLLHEGSANPQTMQFLAGQISRRSGGDNVLEREAYAVSAGFALGLVALGRGADVLACAGTLVDRLFHYAGGREFNKEKHLLIPGMDEYNRTLEGSSVNIDVTAPGAIFALALMFLKTDSEVIATRLSIPCGHFDLQYVRPDFIMLRVIAQNLIMWKRINPTQTWIDAQIPEIVKNGVESLQDDDSDIYEMDGDSIVQAYVNIVTGACVSLGLKYAGSSNGDVQNILHDYAIHILNEIKPILGSSGSILPKRLSKFVDRGSLETCLHLIVLSLAMVMAGSGDLKTFRLLRFLRGRNPADGQSNYGIQMAVSLAIGFLFLGGGMRTFSTSNSAIAALLITLYPRFPTGPNDNRCHLQAYRHLYVLATEARWLQTVDVDTGLPVYAPLEITTKETDHHPETTFPEVTPCILPERGILKTVRVCGPRYWPQVIELVPEDKPWWGSGDRNHPFNSGVLYIKRKVGTCSFVDDPTGCESSYSRAMDKAFSLTSMKASISDPNSHDGCGSVKVDQLVSTFSSDPSLIAFAQLCRDLSWNSHSDANFQEFCLQVLFECVSEDRPALLQVYLSLYTMTRSMADQVKHESVIFSDALQLSSLKLALAYNEAFLQGRLVTPRTGIIRPVFLETLKKRLEDLLTHSPDLQNNLHNYLKTGRWPSSGPQGEKNSVLLSWYLQWFSVPSPFIIHKALEKTRSKHVGNISTSLVPLLSLLLPRTHLNAIREIDRVFSHSDANVGS